ncbi:MAG: RelA/SpoT AH/RIS domain-containing protein, partial [Eggerthella lenta]
LGISSAQSMRALKSVADHMGYKDADDMLVHIGTGKESAQHVANRLLKILVDKGHEAETAMDYVAGDMSTGKMPPMLTSVKAPKKHEAHTSNGVVVKGVDDVLVRLSRCCNPVPGDEILGFVTRGRGVSVHRADCPNAQDLKQTRAYHRGGLGERSAEEHVVQGGGVLGRARPHEPAARRGHHPVGARGERAVQSTTSHRDGMVEMRFCSRCPISTISISY